MAVRWTAGHASTRVTLAEDSMMNLTFQPRLSLAPMYTLSHASQTKYPALQSLLTLALVGQGLLAPLTTHTVLHKAE